MQLNIIYCVGWDLIQMGIIILSNWKKQLPILLCLIGFFFIAVGLFSMGFRGDNTLLWVGLGEAAVGVVLFAYFRSKEDEKAKG